MSTEEFNKKMSTEANHMSKADDSMKTLGSAIQHVIGEPSLRVCIDDLLRHIFENEKKIIDDPSLNIIFLAAERLEDCLTYDAPLSERPRVVISIEGGVADVEYVTKGVAVEIKDYDGDCACPNCDEGMYEGGECPHCGGQGGLNVRRSLSLVSERSVGICAQSLPPASFSALK